MSKTIKCQFKDFFQSRKEKLTNMLISEIVFLKANIKKDKNTSNLHYLRDGLDKLEYLLNNLRKYSSAMLEEDFDKILIMIYHIFQNIADNL